MSDCCGVWFVVWAGRMEDGEQREMYERSEFLPVATENAEALKFYTAKPS